MPDYSVLDTPRILARIFYPRKQWRPCPENASDLYMPVSADGKISIVCRFYLGNRYWPWILYFHGNGEIASDYDEIAPYYHQNKLNICVADYRGYGKSGGNPTFSDLPGDARTIFEVFREELHKRGSEKNVWVMGRSLGSISALELAYGFQNELRGLIIESGFMGPARIVKLLGIPVEDKDLQKIDQECIRMARGISVPALIIHGELDDLVPIAEARDLYREIGSQDKKLLVIPEAGHNDIMFVGFNEYFDAIQQFVGSHGGSDHQQ